MGGQIKQLFAYGTYCGPGHPPSLEQIDKNGTKRTLLSLYPPQDDLDAICYAHDYCYALSESRISCDDIFHEMVIEYQSEFTGRGCWNIATDIIIAFFGKNYEKGTRRSETVSNRTVRTILGIPIATFWFVAKLPIRMFLSEPIEGSCNLAEISNPVALIEQFESLYPSALFNDTGDVIRIPYPDGE